MSPIKYSVIIPNLNGLNLLVNCVDSVLQYSKNFELIIIDNASNDGSVGYLKELEERLRESGLSPKSFEDHLKTFRWGMPPHSGWGFGLDRFLMILTGMKNIREVVLYPRDQDRLLP